MHGRKKHMCKFYQYSDLPLDNISHGLETREINRTKQFIIYVAVLANAKNWVLSRHPSIAFRVNNQKPNVGAQLFIRRWYVDLLTHM